MIRRINFPQDAGTKYTQFRYPGGEVQVRLHLSEIERIKIASKVIVYATIKDGEVMALAQLLDAIHRTGDETHTYNYIDLVLPYLPYARADRAFVEGDCVGLRVFSRAAGIFGVRKILTLDVHSERSERYFLHLANVSPLPLIEIAIESIEKNGEAPIILLPDEGARRYRLPDFLSLHCSKKRDPETGKLSGFIVPKKEDFDGRKNVLIVDDICDGGGTFIGIAEELKDYGLNLYLYVTHGIFSKGVDVLAPFFERIYTTDSLNPAPHEKLTIIPCGGTILGSFLSQSQLHQIE